MAILSVNAPVPRSVAAVADEFAPVLTPFDRVRGDHTFVVKRLGDDAEVDPYRVRERLRTLIDVPPVRARLDGVGVFENPPSGSAPVVYLAVDSPGIVTLHERLVEAFDAVGDIEGDGYTPHVTLARGGDPSPDLIERLRERSVPETTWTVDRVFVYDASYDTVAAELSLPP